MESEGGHIKADAFTEKLEHLLVALNEIDRAVAESGTPKLYYRIVQASHTNALRLTLEAVVRKGAKVAPDHAHKCRSIFFRELHAIITMEPASQNIDLEFLDHIRDVVLGIGEDFKNAEISNGEDRIQLDKRFEDHVKELTGEECFSRGGLEGTLDAANIHGTMRRFWIYPKVGPTKVRCDFLPGTQAEIKDALGRFVRVVGLKFFRANSPHPFRIKVTNFNILSSDEAVSINELRGIAPDATGELNAVEFVRKIRDEWD
jgi:hypothetical protein